MTSPHRLETGNQSDYIDTSAYWAGLLDRRLMVQFCLDTHRYQHIPRPVSLYTGSRNLAWREVSGAGALIAWTRMRVATQPMAPGNFCQALIQLDEQVQLVGMLADDADLSRGTRLEIEWHAAASQGVLLFRTIR